MDEKRARLVYRLQSVEVRSVMLIEQVKPTDELFDLSNPRLALL